MGVKCYAKRDAQIIINMAVISRYITITGGGAYNKSACSVRHNSRKHRSSIVSVAGLVYPEYSQEPHNNS